MNLGHPILSPAPTVRPSLPVRPLASPATKGDQGSDRCGHHRQDGDREVMGDHQCQRRTDEANPLRC